MSLDMIVVRCTTLERYFCRGKGIEFPCVFCEDDCTEVQKEHINFSNGTAIRTPNSSLIHMNLGFKDDMDKFLYSKIKGEIGRATRIIMKEVESGYDVSFFISYEDVKSEKARKKLQDFMLAYPEKVGSLVVGGKSQINMWTRKAANTLLQMLK